MSLLLGVRSMEFDLIYADPPWNFQTWSDKGKEIKNALEDLKRR